MLSTCHGYRLSTECWTRRSGIARNQEGHLYQKATPAQTIKYSTLPVHRLHHDIAEMLMVDMIAAVIALQDAMHMSMHCCAVPAERLCIRHA